MFLSKGGFLKHAQVHEPVRVLFVGIQFAHHCSGGVQLVVDEHKNGVGCLQLHVLPDDEHELSQREFKRNDELVFFQRVDDLQFLAAFHHHRNPIRMLFQNQRCLDFALLKRHGFAITVRRKVCHVARYLITSEWVGISGYGAYVLL